MLRRLVLLWVAASAASATPINIASETFITFRQGAELRILYPYPDLQFLDNLQPVSLFWAVGGRLPVLSLSSYEFSAQLQSLDASNSVALPNVSGAPTTLCLDSPFPCAVTEPGIVFIFQYKDALGLSTLVGPNNVAGSPALRFLVRNEGPSLALGVPGGTFGGLSVSWNTDAKGVSTSPVQILLVDVPEPNTLALVLVCLSGLTALRAKRTDTTAVARSLFHHFNKRD